MRNYTDSMSGHIDWISNPAAAANLKVTPVPAAAAAMAKALLAARESKMAGAMMAIEIAGAVEFSFFKPSFVIDINSADVTLTDIRSGKPVTTTFSGIDVEFLAAFDAMFT